MAKNVRFGINNEIKPGADLPGMQFKIPSNYNQISYYGRRPHESYIDREKSAAFGIYNFGIDELNTPYIKPQEHGNRMGVRWFRLIDRNGKGLQIEGKDLNASAWPYSQEDLATITHNVDLPKRDFITVNVDYGQTGLGGDDTWTIAARPHEEHRLPAKTYSYSFTVLPLR